MMQRLRPLLMSRSLRARPVVLSRSVTATTTTLFSSASSLSTDTANHGGATSEPPAAWLSFPVNHSRRKVPPIAPAVTLASMTSDVLDATLGSLFRFDERHANADANDVADVTTQRVERLLRGHAALVPGSVVARIDPRHRGTQEDGTANGSDDTSAHARALLMERVLARLEQEGDHYQRQAEQHRLDQLVPDTVTDTASLSLAPAAPPPTVASLAPRPKPVAEERPIPLRSAAPGPSIHMYDLCLDAAVCAPGQDGDTLSRCQHLHDRALARHVLDGDDADNEHDRTLPTYLTYNALLRAAADTTTLSTDYTVENCHRPSPDDARTRDAALTTALDVCDALYASRVLDRNAATYVYLFRALRRHLPECRSRGNVVRALFQDCTEVDGVLNASVLEELRQGCGGGKEYDAWIKTILDVDRKDLPRKWSHHAKKRRYGGGKDDSY